MRVLIVGCGYVGLPLGRELVRQGHEVLGLRRSTVADAELRAVGIQPCSGDVTRPEALSRLTGPFDWVVNCVSSTKGGVEEYREVYVNGSRNLIEWLGSAPPKKFVYTSSTSVYGQMDGLLVKEDSPTEPASETSKLLVEAEKLLVAVGRKPNTENIGLEKTKVELDRGFIKVDELFHIAKRLRRVALESAVLGMALSIVGMAFAAAGFLTPVAGAIAQEVIDVLAIANALRAARPPARLHDYDR
jgi:hypothetical protein